MSVARDAPRLALDVSGQALAYVYYEEGGGPARIGEAPTRDEARRNRGQRGEAAGGGHDFLIGINACSYQDGWN